MKDPAKRKVVEEVVGLLVELRARFDEFVASGEVRKACNNPTYSV